jgi:preprotein translocase subunit SecF
LFVLAVASLVLWGLKFGIDFTGGSLLQVKFKGERPAVTQIEETLKSDSAVGQLNSLIIQPVGATDMELRFQETSEETHKAVVASLAKLAGVDGQLEEMRFDSVGPSIGKELKQKSVNAIFFVLIAIVIYISVAFRKVSKPVASWKYGLSALIALAHDAIITLGVFAALGRFSSVEINTPFVAAILTVIGYSVHDTIVVFDRIRENLPRSNEDFEGTVNTSLNQTLVRSINTSLTVILTLVAVLVFGGESIRPFALALTIGIAIGTYSSIFVASPLLVVWEKWNK